MKLVHWLEQQKAVTKVIYPGLKTTPGYDIMKKQSRGFGAMLTFEVDTKEFAAFILNHVKLIQFAESLGGTETLLTYPITQTHADVPPELLKRSGITDRILRLSVGIEAAEDLINEFERVFRLAYEQRERQTNSLKYDFAKQRGMPQDILPLWVADMDFKTSSYIQEAIGQQAEHGIFGYSEVQEEYFEILKSWMQKHYDWNVDRKWLIKTPGIVFALAMAVKAFTEEGMGYSFNFRYITLFVR